VLDTGNSLHTEGDGLLEAEVERADKSRFSAYIGVMKPYIAIVHKDPDSAYGMTFPDAPGCFSAADEMDDLFAMASEALELWAEGCVEDGLTIPSPRDYLEIRNDPEWSEAFEDSVFTIAVPPPAILLKHAA
jgi:predicted RNase H-like HicB family nuclease